MHDLTKGSLSRYCLGIGGVDVDWCVCWGVGEETIEGSPAVSQGRGDETLNLNQNVWWGAGEEGRERDGFGNVREKPACSS